MAWHELRPTDQSIFQTAPDVHAFGVELAGRSERVWESLASDESLAGWPMGPGLGLHLRWTSPRPFGVGTTRDVTLPLRSVTLRERFFRWDPGYGYSFYAEQANRPGLEAFAENYDLTGRPGGEPFWSGPSPSKPFEAPNTSWPSRDRWSTLRSAGPWRPPGNTSRPRSGSGKATRNIYPPTQRERRQD